MLGIGPETYILQSSQESIENEEMRAIMLRKLPADYKSLKFFQQSLDAFLVVKWTDKSCVPKA